MRLKDVLRLRPLTRHLRVRIRRGPCRGRLWSIATRSSFLRGTYEEELSRVMSELTQAGDVFWDVGAHYGYYTLLAAGSVGPNGTVYSFEPHDENQWYLEHHIKWNRLHNVTPLPFALGAKDGEASFGGSSHGMARLGGGDQVVAVRRMDTLVADGVCMPPTVLKVDIEGAEANFLSGARETLTGSSAILILETHSHSLFVECKEMLKKYGFSLYYPEAFDGVKTAEGEALNRARAILAVGGSRSVPDEHIEAFITQ